MAYCVNCGVELAPSEKKCPLCSVRVVRVEGMAEEKHTPSLYPTDIPHMHMGFKELLPALAVLLLIPIVICIICDMLITKTLTWSTYVISAMMLAYVYIFVPFILKKRKRIWYISLCTIATLLFLLFISEQQHTITPWFLPLGLPICLSAGIMLLLVVLVFEKFKNKKLIKAATAFFAAGIFTVLINIFVNLFFKMNTVVTWSLYSLAPCVIIGVVLLMLERNTRLKAEAKRRFFI